eukprot:9503937-Pyramimonas_sp.AAC.2
MYPHALVSRHPRTSCHACGVRDWSCAAGHAQVVGTLVFAVILGNASSVIAAHGTEEQLMKVRITSPRIASRHCASHHATAHRLTPPHMASRHRTCHHVTAHRLTPPHMASRHRTWHHATAHRLTSPRMASRHRTWHHFTTWRIGDTLGWHAPTESRDGADGRGAALS